MAASVRGTEYLFKQAPSVYALARGLSVSVCADSDKACSTPNGFFYPFVYEIGLQLNINA